MEIDKKCQRLKKIEYNGYNRDSKRQKGYFKTI